MKVLATAIALSLSGLPVLAQESDAVATEGQVSATETEESYYRLMLSARAGDVGRAHLHSNGQRLFIALTERADLEEWRERGQQLVQQHSLYHSATVQQLEESAHLIIELARPVRLVDETLSMSVLGLVSWELIFANQDDVDAGANLLDAVVAAARGALVELTFSGHHDLMTEITFRDSPEQLVIDLPGVSPQRYARTAPLEMPALLGMPQVESNSQGDTRLVFTPQRPLDLVDAHTSVDASTQSSNIHLLLVPDAEVSERALLPAGTLSRLELSTQANAGLNLVLGELGEASINSYFLEAPGRLMIDLPGVSPDAVESAVAAFTTDEDYVRRIRFGTTRLGSARLELTLQEAYAAQLARETMAHRDSFEAGTIVSMPEAARTLSGGEDSEDLAGLANFERDTLRNLPRFDFSVEPALTIGSVTLAASQYPDEADNTDAVEAQRFSLLSALDGALERDSVYLAARADFRARQELVPQARAEYLPQVSFSYQYSAQEQDVMNSGTIPERRTSLAAMEGSITLTQPIYRASSLIGMSQAEKAVQQAELAVLAAEQDLLMRIAEAYLNVLAAQDALAVAKAESDAISSQLEQTEVSYRNGLASRSDLNEAQSLAAVTRVRMIEARNLLDDAQLGVMEIIGIHVDELQTFRADFRAVPPFPAQVSAWVGAAREHNLTLQSRRMAEQIAEDQVRRERAERRPTVDLFASSGYQDADQTLFSDQRQTLSNYEVGVRVSMPLYSGGRTSSKVREAFARQEQSSFELESEYRKTERLVRSAFNGVSTSADMLSALREGVLAQEVRLATRLRGFQAGIESSVAVLDAYQSYYNARRDYLQSRYDYLMNRLILKQAVGTLSRNDLAELDRLLVSADVETGQE